MAEAVLPQGAVSAEPAQQRSDDGIRVHAHVFSFPVKQSTPPDFKRQLLRRLGDAKKSKFLVEEYAAHLAKARAELLSNLETPTVSDVEVAVTQTFQDYAALLLGLLVSGTPPQLNGDASAPASTSPRHEPLGTSQMRNAVLFEWQDVLMTKQVTTSPDAVFELASVVIAVAGWRMRRAAYLCPDTRSGISSEQASKAYRLLLLAAGGFQYVEEACAPLLAGSCASGDCTTMAASALKHITLADAQSITTLRAMAKNNAPGLIASLAVETAKLYNAAASSAQAAPVARPGSKVLKYAEYKAAVFQAYALCFTGLVRLKETQAGQAVRLLEESKFQVFGALPIAAAYNKAEPSTPAADHKQFDADLSICVDSALARAKKDNENVYYQRPPRELPALAEPRRLVTPAALTLPPAAPSVLELRSIDAFAASAPPEATVSRGAEGLVPVPVAAGVPGPSPVGAPQATAEAAVSSPSPDGGDEPASCWRWLLVVLAMPFLVLLTAVGFVLWIVLLPVKVICCPVGFCIQSILNVVEYLLKAPFNALLWASGKPWKEKQKDVESH